MVPRPIAMRFDLWVRRELHVGAAAAPFSTNTAERDGDSSFWGHLAVRHGRAGGVSAATHRHLRPSQWGDNTYEYTTSKCVGRVMFVFSSRIQLRHSFALSSASALEQFCTLARSSNFALLADQLAGRSAGQPAYSQSVRQADE